MGYYVKTRGVDFTLPAENLQAAYAALVELNRDDSIKSGRRFGRTKLRPDESTSVASDPSVYFAWMPWNYDALLADVSGILSELGFEFYTAEDGSLHDPTYNIKTGDEEYFFAALAPFVKDGSFIEWEGEDGELWRWLFEGGAMLVQRAVVTWE